MNTDRYYKTISFHNHINWNHDECRQCHGVYLRAVCCEQEVRMERKHSCGTTETWESPATPTTTTGGSAQSCKHTPDTPLPHSRITHTIDSCSFMPHIHAQRSHTKPSCDSLVSNGCVVMLHFVHVLFVLLDLSLNANTLMTRPKSTSRS